MIIDDNLLNRVTSDAQASPRLRMNFNLHESLDAKAQRLINLLLPGTEVPVHRHRSTAETYIILRGKLEVMFHDSSGSVTSAFMLDPLTGNYGVQIPKGQWHSIRVVEPTAIFEVKDGPYTPLGSDDILQ